MKKTPATTQEMQKFLAEAREKLRALTFSGQMKREKDVHAQRKLKKEIARALTGLKNGRA